MSEYKASVVWTRSGAAFTDNRYSRGHLWKFDGGIEVPASSSPQVVPLPLSDANAVDPEEAFVASLSSCHMLWFLSIAAKQGFVVDSYQDDAIGVVGRNSAGKQAMVSVTLRPSTTFSGAKIPTPVEISAMHAESHEKCYIANSVTADVRCEPPPE